MPDTPVYRRILLKLSGEALMGEQKFGIAPDFVARLADEIREVHDLGVETAVVLGGGNIIRGVSAAAQGIDRVAADHMGLLATVINGLALQDALEKRAVRTRLMSAVEMRQIAEPFIRRRAIRHLEKGRVVLFVGGTGNPVLHDRLRGRAARQRDPCRRPAEGHQGRRRLRRQPRPRPRCPVSEDALVPAGARRRDSRSWTPPAVALCMENGIPIKVFNLKVKGNIQRVVAGEDIGSLVSAGGAEA
jgi:uridylate kinase